MHDTNEFMEALGVELRTARAAADVSNIAVARALDRSPSTVSGWFRGSGSPPRIDRLYELARAIGVPLSTVIEAAEARLDDPEDGQDG